MDLTSIAKILVESKHGLCLLLVSAICASLALTLADLIERNALQFSSVVDSFLFLLASFYATALPIPRRRNSLLTQAVVHSVWLIAILPLSNYFRGELVSRLSIRSHGDVMDTLEELHDSLSREKIIPCLRVGTLIHHTVTRNVSFMHLHHKLSLAFYAAKERSYLESVSSAGCLSCAKQKDHVCFTDRLSRCFQHEARGFIQSRDTLNLALIGMPIRKNFALKVPFRNLVQRIREAGLFRERKLCVSRSANNGDSDTLQQSDQLAELSRFLVIFALFLAASSFVFVLELVIGKL
ncbi:uncharacterized protein LOC125946290 [Dermacentor silvarum]|uniref:uncharacterized protein LOC125946290 n=1 Tax=Dermacentor silvarum TaxID=543639 RepID=UPI0021019513|nr:uncharacterized protein LOC125946290 [Dermacentor silvarum]